MPISTIRNLFSYWRVLPQREGVQVIQHGVGARGQPVAKAV
jgi:hypothetical protein